MTKEIHPTVYTIRSLAFACDKRLAAVVALALDDSRRFGENIMSESSPGMKAAKARLLDAYDHVTYLWSGGAVPGFSETVARFGDRADYRLACTLQSAYQTLCDADRRALRLAAEDLMFSGFHERVRDEARYLVELFDSQERLEAELSPDVS